MGCGAQLPFGDGILPPYPNPSAAMTNYLMVVATIVSIMDSTHAVLSIPADHSFDAVSTGDSNITLYRPIITDLAGGTGCLSGSIQWETTLTSRDTASFSVFSEDGTLRIYRGQPVLIRDSEDGDLFGGVVDQLKAHTESKIEALQYDCQCVSWEVILGRRLVGTYQNGYSGTALEIITQLVYQHADGEGFNVVQSGSTIPNPMPALGFAQWDYGSSVSNALDDVCTKSYGAQAYRWYVDAWKRIYFVAQNTVDAPFGCEDYTGDGSFGEFGLAIDVTLTGEKLANRIYVSSSKQLVASATETFTGSNSGQTTFNTSRPIGSLPVITDSRYGAQTAGVDGVDKPGSFDWYWSEGSSTLRQDTSGLRPIEPPTSVTQISVTYQGEETAFAYFQYDAGVNAQAATTGGTGFCDALITLGNVSQPGASTAAWKGGYAAGTTYAQGDAISFQGETYVSLVPENVGNSPATSPDSWGPPSGGLTLAMAVATEFGQIPKAIELTTWRGGLRPAQRFPVKMAKFDLDGYFLIDSVKLSTEGNLKLWTIHAVQGALIGDWKTGMIDLVGGDTFIGGGMLPSGSVVPTTTWDGLTYELVVKNSGVITADNIALSIPGAGLTGIAFWLIYVDELSTDCFVTTVDPVDDGTVDDPVTTTVVPNSNRVTPLEFALNDFILWNDPTNGFEIGKITAMVGNTWTIQRHYPGEYTGKSTFEAPLVSHPAGIRLYKAQVRQFLFDAKLSGYDPSVGGTKRFDMPMPSVCVIAATAAPYYQNVVGGWKNVNCATTALPGLRSCLGGEFSFQTEFVSASSGTLVAINSFSIDLAQPQRVNFAYSSVPISGTALVVNLKVTSDGGSTWETLETLTIAVGEVDSWSESDPPVSRHAPYSGTWPFRSLRAGDRLNFTVESGGTSGLTIKMDT